MKMKTLAQKNQKKNKSWNTGHQQQNPYIVVPYYKGLSESLKRTCKMYGNASLLQRRQYHQKPPDGSQGQRSYAEEEWIIYRYKCDRVECDEEYIGESSRTFGERFKEHQKTPSPIFNHYNTTGHKISLENFGIVGREDQNLMRIIKEALYIRVNNPSLNRNIGKYHLPQWFNIYHTIYGNNICQGFNICLYICI